MDDYRDVQKALEMKKLYDTRMEMIRKIGERKAQIDKVTDKALQEKCDFEKAIEYAESIWETIK